MFENQQKCDIFLWFSNTVIKMANKTLSVMMSSDFFWVELLLIWSLSSRLIGQHWIFCPSVSQINLRNWVRILLRSGSPFLRRVINLKSRADHGHSSDVVADTQGHCISGGNEPNLIRVFDVSYVIKKWSSYLPTWLRIFSIVTRLSGLVFKQSPLPVSQYPQCPFWCIPSLFVCKIQNKIKGICVGRESNPDQLLGRQLCWPLYHRRFCFVSEIWGCFLCHYINDAELFRI